MKTWTRRFLRLVVVLLGLALASIFALLLWLWWPDANKLTGAAARGDVDGVQWCLWFGVDVNEPSRWGWHGENDGQTPLTAAAQQGRVEIVKLLLQSGADPNLHDSGATDPNQTPLSTAATHGQLEVCRVLLEAGADPNLPTNPRQPGDQGGWTALDWALQANALAVADLLRRHGGRESGRRQRGGG